MKALLIINNKDIIFGSSQKSSKASLWLGHVLAKRKTTEAMERRLVKTTVLHKEQMRDKEQWM